MSKIQSGKWLPIAAALTTGAIALGSAAAFASSGSAAAGTPVVHSPARGELARIAGYLKLAPGTLIADLKAGKSLDQIAATQNVPTATLTTDVKSDMQARMNKLVASGKLTQAQAAAREARFDANLPKLLSRTGPLRMEFLRGRPGMGHGPGFGLMAETAKLLNLKTHQLMADLHGGQTVAQVAQAQNVNAQTLTQELESWAQQQVNTRISHFVNNKLPRNAKY